MTTTERPTDGYQELRDAFAHVVWIGGAPDSGKTSVARALATTYSLQVYHYDQLDRLEWPGHWARIDPVRHPAMHRSPVRDRDGMWVDTTPEDLVACWLQTTPERFQLTQEDLRELPSVPPLVAEGYGFTPDLVLPLLRSARQAIWLVPTAEFKRATYDRRGKGTFADTRDPVRARYNHFARDLLLGEHIRTRALELGLTVVEIDGTRSLQEIISLTEAHLAPFLGRAA